MYIHIFQYASTYSCKYMYVHIPGKTNVPRKLPVDLCLLQFFEPRSTKKQVTSFPRSHDAHRPMVSLSLPSICLRHRVLPTWSAPERAKTQCRALPVSKNLLCSRLPHWAKLWSLRDRHVANFCPERQCRRATDRSLDDIADKTNLSVRRQSLIKHIHRRTTRVLRSQSTKVK